MRSCFAFALAGILTACQTPHEFVDDPRAVESSIQIGQLKYSSGGRVLVGEVIVRHWGTTGFQIEFQKGVGVPLLNLRMDGTTARAEGPLARGVWQGPPNRAPKPLRGWIELRDAFAAQKTPAGLTHTSRDSQQRFDFILSR
jgi:hypothetical protein